MKTILISDVTPIHGSTDAKGNVLLKYEALTDGGTIHLHFTAGAANKLKGLLDTPIKTMRLGGKLED